MRCLFVILGLFLLAVPAPLAAQDAPPPDEALSQIREQVMYARYREAIEQADALLARDDLTAGQHNLALEAKAIAQLAKRDQEAAKKTLQTLYSRDPGHRLSDQDASPVVQGAFARARERRTETVPVELAHEPPTLEQRRAPTVEVTIAEGADAVDELRLAYRENAESSYVSIVMTRDGDTARARVPLASTDEAYTLEYYVEARAPSGAQLARTGTAEQPLQVKVPEKAEEPVATVGTGATPPQDEGGIAGEWWLWTVIGAVVAGGVAVGLYYGLQEEGAPSGTLGKRQLGLTIPMGR